MPRMELLAQLTEEVQLHEYIESNLDPGEEEIDRAGVLATLESMRLLLEHIGEIIPAPDGTSG